MSGSMFPPVPPGAPPGVPSGVPPLMGGGMSSVSPVAPVLDTVSDPNQKIIPRTRPEPDEPRRKLLARWADDVKDAKKFWKPAFDRMQGNMDFVNGNQWNATPRGRARRRNAARDDRYVANIALRHVLQRTAELYPHNPTVKAKRRAKIIATNWDGTQASLQQAEQAALGATQMGMPPPPQALAVLQDVQQVQQYDRLMDRIGKTLEIVYDYNIDEQAHSFKSMMKMTVRRAIITGVGYVKLGFQRAMRMSPEIEARIADMSERLANIERITADLADGELQSDDAEVEELRNAITSLTAEGQLIVREGLAFDYPDSTAVIPDKSCRTLRGFLGSDWVAQEYLLTPDQIQEVYSVDVGSGYTAYDEDGRCSETDAGSYYDAGGSDSSRSRGRACVWEIYHRKDGVVYVVCDGYGDFLQQPSKPDAETERFWPWFAIVLNEGYDDRSLYPQSDIDLLRDMQLELNRARQGLREHRRANRPKTAVAAGILEEPDKEKLRTHPANALLELNALTPGQKIDDVLQVVKMPPIDPAVYDTAPVFEDLLRVLGSDAADQGSTSGATATEVSVAQFSQGTDTSSVTEDLNDVLTEMARAAGQILLLNVSQQVVQQLVGPGAVWPQLDRETVVKNVFLEVDAGADSTPNRQQELQNMVQLMPLLQRIPGISPEWMARQLIQRMGADIDLSDAFAEGLPSMEALNQLMSQPPVPPGAPGPGQGPPGQGQDAGPGPGQGHGPQGAGKGPPRPGDPAADPRAQGAAGMANAQQFGPGTAGSLGPRVPPPQVFGVNGNRPGTGGAMPRMRPGGGLPTP